MYNSNYNPYLNGMNTNMNNYNYNYVQKQEVTKVNGRNGAEAYQLPPNSSVLLLDTSAPVVWLKTTDGASYPTITGYNISPIVEKSNQPAASAQLKQLEERVANIERMLKKNEQSNDESAKSNEFTTEF